MGKTIGILAGMGPRSTSPFLELVLEECQKQYGAKYDMDYPHIMVYSLPTPFFIDREIDEELLKQTIREGVKRLEQCGVDILAIPCNSAHSDFDYITQGIETPVLSIIDETVKSLNKSMKTTLLATELTVGSGLYQKGVEAAGCEYVFYSEWLTEINEIIMMIKNKEVLYKIKARWIRFLEELETVGVEQIIIACTDLNVVLEEHPRLTYIDSAQVLASSLVERYLSIRNEQ